MTTTHDEAMEHAYAIGREHGEAAASWVFDGNTSLDTYARVLAGLHDGDPEVLDALPSPDLSGQWADGYTPRQLFEDVGASPGDASFWPEAMSDLCDQYDLGFTGAVHETVEREAREQVEADLHARAR